MWKLADFGIAKLLTMDAQGQYYAATHVGTPIYMAPEVNNYSYTFTFIREDWNLHEGLLWFFSNHLD